MIPLIKSKLGTAITAALVGAFAYGAGYLVSKPSLEETLTHTVDRTVEKLEELHAEIDLGEAKVVFQQDDYLHSDYDVGSKVFTIYRGEMPVNKFITRNTIYNQLSGQQRFRIELVDNSKIDLLIGRDQLDQDSVLVGLTTYHGYLTSSDDFPKCELFIGDQEMERKNRCCVKTGRIEAFFKRPGEAYPIKYIEFKTSLAESLVHLSATVDDILEHSAKVYELRNSCWID